MAARDLERFARDLFQDEGLYRVALAAGESCRGVVELEAFFRTLGYDVCAADLRAAQGLVPGAAPGPGPAIGTG